VDLSNQPTRDELRQLRFGRTRRQEEAGALARVLVLDSRRRAPAPPAGAGGHHASPATHLRRGHWQRYRHGAVDDWHYERHWVPPVVVNPDGRAEPRSRVYRLPPPVAPGAPAATT
jgi:hypothetical protein